MTNKTRYIPLLLLLLALFSCTSREEREFSALLNRADSLMRTRPDSSLYILNKVGTPSTTSLSMRHALLRADALNKCDSVLPSDTLLRELADYYDRHGSANERMRAHYLLGRCYHDMGEAPRALECYQHAAELADTTRKDCDLYTLYAVYGQMADLYYAQYLPDDEMQALKTCERIAWKDGDTLSAIKAYELRLRPYYQKNDTDSILFYVNHSYQLYRKYGYHQEAANIIGMRICIHLDRHQYAEAQKDRRIYKNESGLFDEHGNIIRGREIRYYDEGRYQLGIGHVDSALYWFRRVGSYGYSEAAYKGMLDVYKQLHKPDSIAKYAELFAKANDDSYLENSMELMRMQTSLYNYQLREKENTKLIKEKNRQKLILIISFSSFITIILMLIVIILRIKEQKRRIHERLEQIQELQHRESIIRKEQKGDFFPLSREENLQRLHEKLLKSSIAILFYERIQTETIPKKEDWARLEQEVCQTFPYFKRTLYRLYPLKEQEFRICLLLKIQMRNKDVAQLISRTHNAITMASNRLMNKMFGKEECPYKDLKEMILAIGTE